MEEPPDKAKQQLSREAEQLTKDTTSLQKEIGALVGLGAPLEFLFGVSQFQDGPIVSTMAFLVTALLCLNYWKVTEWFVTCESSSSRLTSIYQQPVLRYAYAGLGVLSCLGMVAALSKLIPLSATLLI